MKDLKIDYVSSYWNMFLCFKDLDNDKTVEADQKRYNNRINKHMIMAIVFIYIASNKDIYSQILCDLNFYIYYRSELGKNKD